MICQKPHRYDPRFEAFEPSQAGEGRHKCVGCAYDAGLAAGFNNDISDFAAISEGLADSQAGTVRHRDAEQAYQIGYQDGVSRRLNR